MFRQHPIVALLLSVGLLSACTASSSDDASTAKTTSAKSSPALDSAWTKARAGENPSTDCARVKGSLLNDHSPSARKAVAQCTYDIPLHYFTVLLDRVDAGSLTCTDFMKRMSTQLSSLTMSVGGLKRAAQVGESGKSQAEASATDAISTATVSNTTRSASGRIKSALAPRAVEVCPIMTMYLNP